MRSPKTREVESKQRPTTRCLTQLDGFKRLGVESIETSREGIEVAQPRSRGRLPKYSAQPKANTAVLAVFRAAYDLQPRLITLGGLVQLLVAQWVVVARGTHSEAPENVSSTTFSGMMLGNILSAIRTINWLYPSCFDETNMR